MKQLDFGFAARSKSKPPIPFGVAVEDTLKVRMAEMIITIFKKGGVRKDDTSGTKQNHRPASKSKSDCVPEAIDC